MQHFCIGYKNDLTAEVFDYSTEIERDDIGGVLNVMVGVLRLIGFSDNTIEGAIGSTYF